MKTIKKVPLDLIKTEFIPNEMEFGKFYFSERFGVANMLCPCGCGMKTPFPINKENWVISIIGDKFNINPSIQQRMGCKSHFIIQNGNANLV